MKKATLVLLVKKENEAIKQVCLAMKKRGFGMGKWNGVGGKVDKGETIEHAARREALEEVSVSVKKVHKVAELSFKFPHNPDWDQVVYVFISDTWVGEPEESEEMSPEWFDVSRIPYKRMWAADKFWMPKVLSGALIKASVIFGEKDAVVEYKEEEVASFK